MNRKGLAVLMRTRMPLPPSPNQSPPPPSPSAPDEPTPSTIQGSSNSSGDRAVGIGTSPKDVKEWMKASISIPTDKTESLDATLEGFLQGYLDLSDEGRWELVLALARDYDVNRVQVRGLMEQYLGLGLPNAVGDQRLGGGEDEGVLASFYRMERNLRDALKPAYAVLFERLNAYPGGLKLLVILRADLLSLLGKENLPSLRALDSYLKEKLITWLSPAALELHQITWDDSASLLEKIVAYEAVHPIRSLLDLKRRLSVGRRCFGYLHPAIPGEPLIFIEVALLKKIAKSIQEVLLDDPPIPENEATSALFYSISSTQPGLSGINLGKFLIKRVVELLRREMPYITTFATLSPIPGYMPWLLSKLASQLKLAKSEPEDLIHVPQSGSISAFREDILSPEEEIMILESAGEHKARKSGLEVMHLILTSANIEWTKSERVAAALEPPLMRLCARLEQSEASQEVSQSTRKTSYIGAIPGKAFRGISVCLGVVEKLNPATNVKQIKKSRYLVKEKKRRKALDPVANFHLQNGAMIERINWMADQSGKGIHQSAGIMVNYVYRLEKIEEYAQLYLSTGHIHMSIRQIS